MADPDQAGAETSGGPAPGLSEVSSRDDAQLELALEELTRAVAVLAINLKTHLKSPENAIFRGSLENQHRMTLAAVEAVLVHPHTPWDEAATRAVAEAVDSLEAPCAKAPWLGHPEAVRRLFQAVTARVFAPERLARDGPPAEGHAALLGRHATLPAARPPRSATAGPTTPAAPTREVLFERIFAFGDPDHPHEAHVGELYLGFARHARGLDEEAARRTLTPAAVVGFAASLERALGDHRGLVAFRIVREAGRVGMELRRVAGSQPSGGTSSPSRPGS